MTPSPDLSLAAEFRACPLGHHSPALQRLLRTFRTLPVPGKHAALRVDHRRAWVIVQFNGRQGPAADAGVGPGLHRLGRGRSGRSSGCAGQQMFGTDLPEDL